jgi:hypothetical protein
VTPQPGVLTASSTRSTSTPRYSPSVDNNELALTTEVEEYLAEYPVPEGERGLSPPAFAMTRNRVERSPDGNIKVS